MKILIYLGHPAQYMFLRETINQLSRKGIKLRILIKTKDILETSEGRYALIDEKKVTYFVQQGEWLGEVFVKHIDKYQVELKEIDGETIIILELKP